MSNCATPYRAISFISFIHYSRGGEVVGYNILLKAGVCLFEFKSRQTKIAKSGRDNSTTKCSAIGESVTGLQRWP